MVWSTIPARSIHESPPRPAPPSTHPSQIGHLTTSSPIIQADHVPEVHLLDQPENLETLSQSASSAEAGPGGHALDPTPSLSASSSGLQLPSDPSSRRSKSPAGRFKDAFSRNKTNVNAQDRSSTAHSSNADSISRPSTAAALPSGVVEPGFTWAERGRPKKTQPPPELDLRPHTPPSEPSKPVIVNTPPTPTDSLRPKASTPPVAANPNIVVSPSGNMISHRRARSGSSVSIGPSKLSNIVSGPLTPTPENAVPPTPSAGFFSSVLSAAQNAATTLSTTITNTGISPNGTKPRPTSTPETSFGDDDRVEVESSADVLKNSTMDGKEPAVKTLGMGDLSLSQLGFQESGSAAPTPVASKFSDLGAESRARSDSAPVESESSAVHDHASSDDFNFGRAKSVYEPPNVTPPASVYESGSGIHRSSSIRSAISKRRKRGSTGGTTGTGNTIGAAIAAANASLAHPSANGSAPKLTGFAVASKKRNRDFHGFFKSVPDDDYLIEDYSCAIQREILAHGRLYVSEGHICFSSNILGWVTTLVISFDEVVSVEKKSTALVFKNGLMISTLHAKHTFASFASRDSTYDLIVNIWKLGHPTLRSSLNGVSLDETGGDKTEKIDDGDRVAGSQSESESESGDSEDDEDIYDEDLEDDEVPINTQQTQGSPVETDGEKAVSRKVSGVTALNSAVTDKAEATSPTAGGDFPGPATHGATDCGDADTHYEVIAGDEIIAAPLGKIYNLMFGPGSVSWMSKWLTNEEKCTDLQMEDKKGLTQDNKTRTYSYIKPLNSSIGPKQTKCIVSEAVEVLDLEKAVIVVVGVQTPDVPSGNIFSVKTKYCLSWAENNATRVIMSCTIEWSGKSWLKGPIEKGAKDGQAQYAKAIFTALKGAVSARARPAAAGGMVKGKKKKGKGKLNGGSKSDEPASAASSKTSDWGVFEPIHKLASPVLDILKPVMTGNVVYGLLVGLLVAAWFGFGLSGQQRGFRYGRDMAFSGYADRAVAYEEIWNREESDLWDWLEERVGLHRMNEGIAPVHKRVMEPRTAEEKLRAGRMNEREVEEAIRVTEEKLDILKSVMDRKKGSVPEGSGIATTPLTGDDTR
ncbi:hypothetical protein F5Y16DRAFT_204046 [Xylariaceae sp. FL0255]|nr:hypothetical protein F5Y16DRAFT_204046 [Xylariaceae sp. FL0255]